jgi:hypothetical protein
MAAKPGYGRGVQREQRMQSTEMDVLHSTEDVPASTIERVTFHNVENGFCVLRVKACGRRDLITVVGHAASISAASG